MRLFMCVCETESWPRCSGHLAGYIAVFKYLKQPECFIVKPECKQNSAPTPFFAGGAAFSFGYTFHSLRYLLDHLPVHTESVILDRPCLSMSVTSICYVMAPQWAIGLRPYGLFMSFISKTYVCSWLYKIYIPQILCLILDSRGDV